MRLGSIVVSMLSSSYLSTSSLSYGLLSFLYDLISCLTSRDKIPFTISFRVLSIPPSFTSSLFLCSERLYFTVMSC